MSSVVPGGSEGLRGGVELRDVEFAFPTKSDVTILKGMSFKLQAGHHAPAWATPTLGPRARARARRGEGEAGEGHIRKRSHTKKKRFCIFIQHARVLKQTPEPVCVCYVCGVCV